MYNVINVDITEFHSVIIDEMRKYGCLSSRIINEDDIVSLIDPVINILFFLKRNIISIDKKGKHSHLLLFYTLDDFIEIFDDLQIAFSLFLETKGIHGDKVFKLSRPDNFRTFFTEVRKDELFYFQ